MCASRKTRRLEPGKRERERYEDSDLRRKRGGAERGGLRPVLRRQPDRRGRWQRAARRGDRPVRPRALRRLRDHGRVGGRPRGRQGRERAQGRYEGDLRFGRGPPLPVRVLHRPRQGRLHRHRRKPGRGGVRLGGRPCPPRMQAEDPPHRVQEVLRVPRRVRQGGARASCRRRGRG